MNTRFVFLLFTVVILYTSASIFAGFGGGNGTPDDPYLIYTKEHLLNPTMLKRGSELHVKLMDDIDFKGESCLMLLKQSGLNGVFEGNYKRIKNFITKDRVDFL